MASALINVMTAAARKASFSLRRDFGEIEQLQTALKGVRGFAESARARAGQAIRGELTRARPEYGVLMSIGEEIETRDRFAQRWIVDPLAGFGNFSHGLPHIGVVVALEQKGETVGALIVAPLRDETFWAEKGAGAFMNGRRLRVSARRDLHEAALGCAIPATGQAGHPRFHRDLATLSPKVADLRALGTPALDIAHVAAGRLDGYWGRGLAPWETAAAALILREAGGFVREEEDALIAANAALCDPIAALLTTAGAAASS